MAVRICWMRVIGRIGAEHERRRRLLPVTSSAGSWSAHCGGHPEAHAPGEAPAGPQEPAGHLLQILDETYRGYQDSRWLLDTTGDVPRTRETATGMALVDAQLLAAMRRTIAHGHVQFDLRPYRALTPPQLHALDQAATRYGQYLQLNARLTLP